MPEEISWDRNKHFPCGLVLLSVLDGSHSFPLPCGPGLLPRASHLSPQPQLFSEVARGGPGEQLMADNPAWASGEAGGCGRESRERRHTRLWGFGTFLCMLTAPQPHPGPFLPLRQEEAARLSTALMKFNSARACPSVVRENNSNG